MGDNAMAPWQRRDNFSVDRHQELVDAANAAPVYTDDDGAELRRGPFGQNLSRPRRVIPNIRVAKIVGTSIANQSPGGTTTTLGGGWFTANLQLEKNTQPDDPSVTLNLSDIYEDESPSVDCYVRDPAENLTGGHTLTTGSYVIVRLIHHSKPGVAGGMPSLVIGEVLSGGSGALSTGEFQGMLYQMVAGDQGGWDWTIAHPMI